MHTQRLRLRGAAFFTIIVASHTIYCYPLDGRELFGGEIDTHLRWSACDSNSDLNANTHTDQNQTHFHFCDNTTMTPKYIHMHMKCAQHMYK